MRAYMHKFEEKFANKIKAEKQKGNTGSFDFECTSYEARILSELYPYTFTIKTATYSEKVPHMKIYVVTHKSFK